METNVRKVIVLVVTLVAMTASLARAADQKVELGASLASAIVGLGNNNVSTLGIPSGGFGVLNPGVYASFFVGPHLAVEPQVGLLWASSGGHSEHILNAVAQVDYFISGIGQRSAYVFGAAGVTDVSGSPTTPKSVGAGTGYRLLAGDRLTFRIDGRVTHFTDAGGNALAFTVSIGGLFGQR